MNPNIWSYLLDGASSILGHFLNQFPVALPNELLSKVAPMISGIVTSAFFWMTPLVDLHTTGLAIVAFLILETVRIVIAIWRWILALIPAAS